MSSSLQGWLKSRWLKEHKVAGLLAAADRDLAACKTPDLRNDWRFNIAYNAALQLAAVSDCEHEDMISDAEASDMRRLAEKRRADLTRWIDINHSAYR